MLINIFYRMLSIFIARIFPLFTSLYIAMIVREDLWGHISLVLSYSSILLIISGNAFSKSIATYVACYKDNSIEVFNIGNKITIVYSFIILLAFFLIIIYFSPIKDKVAEQYILYYLPLIFFLLLSQNIVNYFQGKGNIKYMSILEIFKGVAMSMITIISVYYFNYSLYGWYVGRSFSILLIFFIFYIILIKKYKNKFFIYKNKDNYVYKEMVNYSKWAMMSAFFVIVVKNLDVIIISEYYNNNSYTGTFKLAIIIFSCLGYYSQSITSTLFHKFAELKNNTIELYNYSVIVKIYSFLLYFCFVFIMTKFSNVVLLYMFGNKFILLDEIINIIIIASLFQNYIFINGGIWTAVGNMKLNIKYFSIYSILYIVILFYFLNYFSFVYFAYAILIATILGAIYSEILTRKAFL